MDPEALAEAIVVGSACQWLRPYLARRWRRHRHRHPEDLVMEVAHRLLSRDMAALRRDGVTADQVVAVLARQVIADHTAGLADDDHVFLEVDLVGPVAPPHDADCVEDAWRTWGHAHWQMVRCVAAWPVTPPHGATLLVAERLALWRRLAAELPDGMARQAAIDATPWPTALADIQLGCSTAAACWVALAQVPPDRADLGLLAQQGDIPRATVDQWLSRARARIRRECPEQDWAATHGHWRSPMRKAANA